MKKILVTGSNGLLGQKLTDLIVGSGRAELICSGTGEDRHINKEGYTYINLDIAKQSEVNEAVRTFRPDAIINTAAVTNVDVCELDKDLCRKVNVDAVSYLVKAASDYSSHLIHLSTDFVFDGLSGPYSEDDLPSPLSYYGKCKADAEKLIIQSASSWSIIRTILVYGVVPGMSRSNIVLWAKASLERKERIRVVNDQWRMPTLAEDLAEACLLVAEKQAPGIFHISGSEMMSVYELVERVGRFWDLDRSLISEVSSDALDQPARRPLKTGFVLDKAVGQLDYRPHSFAEGLQLLDEQLKALKSE